MAHYDLLQNCMSARICTGNKMRYFSNIVVHLYCVHPSCPRRWTLTIKTPSARAPSSANCLQRQAKKKNRSVALKGPSLERGKTLTETMKEPPSDCTIWTSRTTTRLTRIHFVATSAYLLTSSTSYWMPWRRKIVILSKRDCDGKNRISPYVTIANALLILV